MFVVGDDAANLEFRIEMDDPARLDSLIGAENTDGFVAEGAAAVRRYVTTTARVRLHQRAFRERVLAAYRQECALCRFRHTELLDAAHIIPDRDPNGEPVVTNGLALCSLHHGAFDRYFIGIRPDYTVDVRPDILREIDGPTLKHGLQALHGQRMKLPRALAHRPDPDRLRVKYEDFLKACA